MGFFWYAGASENMKNFDGLLLACSVSVTCYQGSYELPQDE